MTRTATRAVEADALEAHDNGLCVIRVKHDGSKAPDPPTPDGKWERFQHERPTRDEVAASMEGRDGFGLVCGAISGNLECTEMEGRAVNDGTYTRFKEALCAAGLKELFDRICAGYMERSPTGGLHWLYRVEVEPVPSGVKLARRPRDDGVDTLIETRAEGNFIVVASSGGRCHETGQPWVLELGGFASIATVTAQERADFHRVAAMFDEMPPPPPRHEPTSRLLATNTGDRPGDQYNASTTWDDVLGRAGWTRVYDKGEATAWRRPGKEAGISATTNHRGTDTLKVFSTSTVLPTDGTLTRFGAFAYLEHGGDFIAAARAVAPAPRPKASVHGRAQAEKVEGVDDVNGIPADTPDSPSPYLPDEFWKTPLLPRLARIRAAAHQRQRSPDAVFHACLARIAAMAPYTLRIPPVVGANAAPCYFAALLSRSGYGKSSTADVASELIPANAQLVGPIPFGSGQGIVEAMFETSNKGEGKSKVKRHTKHNVFVYADEGDTLSALSANTNSTLQPTLRSIWSGSTIGDTNATEERRRIVRAGTYTYGVVIACHAPAAGALLSGVATGLPQRFGWALATHPDVPRSSGPPDDIEPLGWHPPKWVRLEVADEIATEIRTADHARITGAAEVEPLNAHGDLLRLKIASLLALLEDQALDTNTGQVSVDLWELAGVVKRASDAARTVAIEESAAHDASTEDATARRLGRRQATAADVIEAHRLTKAVDVARVLAAKVWGQSDPWAGAALRRSLPSRDRGHYDDALEHAESEEWVAVSEEPSHTGNPKQVVERGARRPR